VKAWLVIGALLVAAPFAAAAPKGKAAKAAFDRGVAAYQKGDFAGASAALAQSYKLEADIETLFAWAQSERQQDKCESAIELYKTLLELDMPAENKAAVQTKLDECQVIVDAQRVPDKPVEPAPVVEPEPDPEPAQPPPPRAEGKTPWWKDPIGDALVIGGVVGLGVGGVLLYQAKSAEDRSFESHESFQSEQDTAESRGRIGLIVTIAGAALVTGGIVRYATRSTGEERTTVSGWVAPGGGGIAAFGRF
jgi:hypothetical protein